MTKLRSILVAATLAAGAGTSHAQGQSSANAHAFLQAVAKAHPVLITDLNAPVPYTGHVVALESSGCASRITSQAAGLEPMLGVLNWQSVASVRVENDRDLRLRGRAVDLALVMPSRELAVRLGNALSLIRRECDPLAGFGF